jgi:hypothetical protein
MAFAGGQRLTAALLNSVLGVTVGDTQTAAGTTTTSANYTATLTGGTACGVAFVAPASGSVVVHNSAFLTNNSTGRSYMAFRIGTGSSIGAGTLVRAASDADMVSSHDTATLDMTAGRAIVVTGLTPGAAYNCQQQFKTSAGTTASFSWKHLAVEPVT